MDEYFFEHEVAEYLRRQFCWFLELNAPRGFRILLNGEPLDYSALIGDRDSQMWEIKDETDTFEFAVKYVRWLRPLVYEYSRFYFVGSDNIERHKDTTTLNNKSDEFYHSVYLTSSFFDEIGITELPEVEDDTGQMSLFSRRNIVYRELENRINLFLGDKRKPFLKRYTDILVEQYERDGVFPQFTNSWEIPRRQELEQLVRDLYVVKPALFAKLNLAQKMTFVRLLNLALDDSERDSLFTIVREVIDLDSSEREDFAKRFQYSRLSNINQTVKLIEDRYRAVEALKRLVFDNDIYVNEPDHIQKMVERHYWLFGEAYHLVAAAERRFEEVLRRFLYVLRGEKRDVSIDHKDKNKEMDIFMVRKSVEADRINNVVLELKNPSVNLGAKELNQVITYLGVISKQDECNAPNMTWQFYLVGNGFDTSGFLEGVIASHKPHGEASLVYSPDQGKTRIYVKTWAEIFTEFELRHRFVLEKLELQREWLAKHAGTADEIILEQDSNTASRPPELVIPPGPGD